MKSIEISELALLQGLIEPEGSQPVLLTSGGRTNAAVVPLQDSSELGDFLCGQSEELERILRDSKVRLDAEGPLTPAQVRQRLGL